MASDEVLDLSDVDPPVWRLMVAGVVYGPYTLGQMRGFVAENRLTGDSKTAEGDGGAFIPAREHPGLAELFSARTPSPAPTPGQLCNHVIVFRGVGDNRDEVIGLLNDHGTFCEVLPGTYLLQTLTQTPRLRELLEAVCEPDDRFMIVNADNGRLGWRGLGPEADVAVRTVWSKSP